MLSPIWPSEARIRQFLARRRGLPYSYPDVGSSLGKPPVGYVLDHHRVRLGEGPHVFERARAALRDWAMFRVGWVEVRPSSSPIEEGTTIALLARDLGPWALFACRVVRVVEEHGPVESYGFAYGTLPGHALSGEERFTVRWDRAEGSVPRWPRPTPARLARDLGALTRRGARLPRGGRDLDGPRAGGPAAVGVPDLIVLLTAIHFHFAGFASLVLAGLVARALGGPAAGAA